MTKTKDIWKKKIQEFVVPTILKEKLLKPYFKELSLQEPILDIGCGAGYFSELFSLKGKSIIGIDRVNTAFPRNSKVDYLTMEARDLSFKNMQFKDILLINVLSCIDDKLEIIKVLNEAKRVKTKESSIYCVLMSEDVYKPLKHDILENKSIDNDKVMLKFKKIDGTYIEFPDNVIKEDEFKKMVKSAGLIIDSKCYFKDDVFKQNIYSLYVLK